MLYIKLVWMYLTAVSTAMFIYPILHELGHLLAAILTGSRIVEFSVFPTSYVMLETVNASAWRTVVVGLCGMIFPMLCALVHPRQLTMSVIVYTIRAANILAWFLSCTAIVFNHLGMSWENEDVINVIRCLGGGENVLFLVCLIAMLLSFFAFFKDKPVSRIVSFF